MSTDRTALAAPDTFDGRVVQGARRMYRYTVPVDDRPHLVLLTSDPVHVASARTLEEVEFWTEHVSGAPEVTRAFQVCGTGQHLPGNARWVGTCPRVSGLVWHLYELAGEERRAA